MGEWLDAVRQWSSAHPAQTVAGVVFVVMLLAYVVAYRRFGWFVRLLFGLATLGVGGWFVWSVLQTLDLTKFAGYIGGAFGLMFLLTIIDDELFGGDAGGRIGPGGTFRIWNRD